MRASRWRFLKCVFLSVCLLGMPHASHADPGPVVDGAEPAERGSDWYVSDSLDYRGAHRVAVGLLGDWAYRPLTVDDTSAAPRRELLTDRVLVRVGATVVLADRFRLGVHVPMSLFDNPGPSAAAGSSAPSFGDLRLESSARVYGEFGAPLTVALGARTYLPTGSVDDFMGAGCVRVEPRAALAGTYRALVYAAGVGAQLRGCRGELVERGMGSELLYNAAIGVKVNDRVVLGPELFGRTAIQGDATWFGRRSSPVELLLGAHLRVSDDMMVGTAIGHGLGPADLAPTLRMLVVVDYAPDVCVDKDGDGICASEDACPELDGVPSADPKRHGCPADSDGDGVLDHEDVCPYTPGVVRGPPETRGCPERPPATAE